MVGCVRADAMSSPTVLLFNSGLGGLTVYREVARARPDAHFLYVADDAAFPYGRLAEADLIGRVVAVMAALIDSHHPDLVVVACNTASTLVLPQLRARFTRAVCRHGPGDQASLCRFAQPAGVRARHPGHGNARIYPRTDPRFCQRQSDHAGRLCLPCGLCGSRICSGAPVADEPIREEIEPCFVEREGARTDTVVLACTHYPLLLDRLDRLAPWPVTYIDPAPAIARRVVELLGPAAGPPFSEPARVIFTSGCAPSPALTSALARFGLGEIASAPFSFGNSAAAVD